MKIVGNTCSKQNFICWINNTSNDIPDEINLDSIVTKEYHTYANKIHKVKKIEARLGDFFDLIKVGKINKKETYFIFKLSDNAIQSGIKLGMSGNYWKDVMFGLLRPLGELTNIE